MSKINLGRNITGQTPRTRGGFYIVPGKRGPIAIGWPKPRGKAKTPYDYYKQEEFGLAGRMASSALADEVLTAMEMCKGTQQVPRDILTMCIFGTYYQLINEDGFIWPTFRSMAPNPQYMLDLVSNTVGDMLYRAEIGWVGLARGAQGNVLTMDNGFPIWKPAPVVPAAETKVTTLKRTTDMTATSATVHVCTWQAAEIDECGIWDPLNPTRIVFPSGATRFRISVNALWTGILASEYYALQTRSSTGSTAWFGAMQAQMYGNTAIAQPKAISAIGPWFTPKAFPYFEAQIQNNNPRTLAWLANSSITLEAVF